MTDITYPPEGMPGLDASQFGDTVPPSPPPITPAFMVQGFAVTAAQRDAALVVMTGVFTTTRVHRALIDAGVTDIPGQSYTVGRAADRIMQSERKAGRIRVAKGHGRGAWEKTA